MTLLRYLSDEKKIRIMETPQSSRLLTKKKTLIIYTDRIKSDNFIFRNLEQKHSRNYLILNKKLKYVTPGCLKLKTF